MGGFYEAILSLMVVTLGVVLLTLSFTFLSFGGASSGDDLDAEAREIMDGLLSSPSLFDGDRVAERSDIVRLPHGAISSEPSLGVRIMITEVNGATEILYQNGGPEGMKERASLSEPVNVRHSMGDVRAASFTLWVWR
jgi:hypothetical protein